jgi:hypothetical protein
LVHAQADGDEGIGVDNLSLNAGCLAQIIVLCGRQSHDEVELASLQRLHGRGDIGKESDLQAVDAWNPAEVARIGMHGHAIRWDIVHDFERPRPIEILSRRGCSGAQDQGVVVGEIEEEEWVRPRKSEDHLIVADGVDVGDVGI